MPGLFHAHIDQSETMYQKDSQGKLEEQVKDRAFHPRDFI
jgi:hypothetical protein